VTLVITTVVPTLLASLFQLMALFLRLLALLTMLLNGTFQLLLGLVDALFALVFVLAGLHERSSRNKEEAREHYGSDFSNH
jgi:hypothetical protein